MARATKLSQDEIGTKLKSLSGWKINGQGNLEKELKRETFTDAFALMTRIAFEAEKLDHHPDWKNSYNRIQIELTTHDAGGLTEKDFELAKRIDTVS